MRFYACPEQEGIAIPRYTRRYTYDSMFGSGMLL